MSKSKLLLYISISAAITAITLVSLYVLRKNDAKNSAIEIDLATPDPNLHDQSWLTGTPCAAPCWYGLKPGETTSGNAAMIVSKLSFVDGNTMKDSGRIVSFLFKVQYDDCQPRVVMAFEDDILESLFIIPSYPITIDQVVEKLGKPDGFSSYPTDPGGTGYYLAVIWKKKQLIVEYTEDSGNISFWSTRRSLYEKIHSNNGKIPKGLIVQDVLYTTPDNIDIMMKDKEKWKGFADN